MKKIALLLAPLMLTAIFSTAANAENEVKASMKNMGKALTAAEKADSAATLKKELTALREATLQAQKQIPDHLKTQPADSPDRKLYAEGNTKLLAQIDNALTLADAGKFDEAKAATAALKTTRNDYHKKLKP